MVSRRNVAIWVGVALLLCLPLPAHGQTPSTEEVTPEPAATPTVVVEEPEVSEPDPVEPEFVEAPRVDETVPVPVPQQSREPRAARPKRETVNEIWWSIGPSRAGLYTTTALQVLTAKLRGRGVKEPSAYAPFPIAGFARFWDSWGEVRRAENGLRPHLGQDVFCRYGDPVLAVEHGTIEFDSDPTGGLVARLYRESGGYWYYAHLSGFGGGLESGQVEPGDVIGFCGQSGNAAGTPPHVHFGLYVNHVAQNPIDALVGWLTAAETHARRELRSLRREPEEVVPVMTKEPLGAVMGTEPEGCTTPFLRMAAAPAEFLELLTVDAWCSYAPVIGGI